MFYWIFCVSLVTLPFLFGHLVPLNTTDTQYIRHKTRRKVFQDKPSISRSVISKIVFSVCVMHPANAQKSKDYRIDKTPSTSKCVCCDFIIFRFLYMYTQYVSHIRRRRQKLMATLRIFLAQVRLGTEVLCTASLTRPGFVLLTSQIMTAHFMSLRHLL